MSRQLDTRLSEADRLALEQVVRKSTDLRARQRAKTLLLLAQPLLSREVAKLQHLNIETVRVTWQRWVKEALEALSGKPRSGALRKLDEEAAVERLLQWAREEPLSATELLQRHIEAQGSPVEVNTLIQTLKANGKVWKRTHHSLKTSRSRRLTQDLPRTR